MTEVIIAIVAIVVLIWSIGTAIVYFSLNAVLSYFGWPEITWLGAFGLMLLISFIGGCFKATVSGSKGS